jgi:hypothetical protein
MRVLQTALACQKLSANEFESADVAVFVSVQAEFLMISGRQLLVGGRRLCALG